MPSPKDGNPCRLVAPAAPRIPHEADVANPGEAENVKAQQQQSGTGKYGEVPIVAFNPRKEGNAADKDTKSWIEIILRDEEGQPVAGERYKVILPDGRCAEGTLDERGLARLEGFDPGSCQISFPNLDGETWTK